MKFLRAAVIVAFLASSSALADSFSFGVRLDAPLFFERTQQSMNPKVTALLGAQVGMEFDSLPNRPGIRFLFSRNGTPSMRFSLDGYSRTQLTDVQQFDLYFGGGSALTLVQPAYVFYLDAHVLVGLEYPLSQRIHVFAEMNGGSAGSLGGTGCAERGEEYIVCIDWVPFMLEAAIGLNFRF
jgi:hypothetical protein